MTWLKTKLSHFARRRPLETLSSHGEEGGAQMEKCLTTLDVVSLGVGSCCGAGMYLTAGIITAQKAGPAGVVSIVLAGLASVLTGVHYAELAGMCPDTSGSAYMYTYVTAGELSAFVIGWGLIVEYVIGTAAAARALSSTLDSVTDNSITDFLQHGMDTIGVPHIDVVAAVVCLTLTWLLASGAEMSARVNNVLNFLNLAVWAIFVCVSFSLGTSKNWTEHGGFFPFGYEGVLAAVPTAYFAFVGFDGLATTGAECKTPVRSIPIGIVLSILINMVVFSAVIMALAWDMPYSLLPADTAMLDVLSLMGYRTLKYIIAVGAGSGLFAATFGSLFPLPRVLQAMAQDGLIFRYFSKVCPKRYTALRATVVSGLVAASLAACVDIGQLIELVLIGTLLAYVIVTFATLVVRFVEPSQDLTQVAVLTSDINSLPKLVCDSGGVGQVRLKRKSSDSKMNEEEQWEEQKDGEGRRTFQRETLEIDEGGNVNPAFQSEQTDLNLRQASSQHSVFARHKIKHDTGPEESVDIVNKPIADQTTGYISLTQSGLSTSSEETCQHLCGYWVGSVLESVKRNMVLFLLCLSFSLFTLCLILSKMMYLLIGANILAWICFAVVSFVTTAMSVLLMLIPQNQRTREGFRAPLVPFITLLTAGINIFLMTSLTRVTWCIFLVWMVVGLAIYLAYGTRHSSMALVDLERDQDNHHASTDARDMSEEDKQERQPLI